MKGAANRVAELEAELAKAKAEVETWKEAHAALARAIQPSIVNVPFVYTPPVYTPPVYTSPVYTSPYKWQPSPFPYYEITYDTQATNNPALTTYTSVKQ